MTDPELRELALDYVAGRVITSHAVPADLWPMVFMPLAFMKRRDLRGVVMVYALTHRDTAVPSRAINGWPMFADCRLMKRRDHTKFLRYVDEAQKTTAAFIEGKP